MIRLEGVSKTFVTKKGVVEALKDVSLEVKRGEIFGVIGYSGAGKSTLIRCVNLLEKPSTGKVFINEVELTALSADKLREERRKIGMIFQGFNLLKTATVYENIALPLRLTGVPSAEIQKRVDKYLAIVGLQDKFDAYPSQLSGGQKQRVAIARALSHEPEILLSDEATSALDPETTESILELLLKINKELGITILLITHEMHVIQKICDRIAVMENGHVIEEGRVIDIYAEPQHSTTRRFIESLFPNQLPESLLSSIDIKGPIVSLSFLGESAGKPALAHVVKEFKVEPNILSGNILQLKDHSYGRLVVYLDGAKEETNKAIDYLKSIGVKVEEVSPIHG